MLTSAVPLNEQKVDADWSSVVQYMVKQGRYHPNFYEHRAANMQNLESCFQQDQRQIGFAAQVIYESFIALGIKRRIYR